MLQIPNPLYGVNYEPGTIGFSNQMGNIISEGVTWLESCEEIASFKASHVWMVVDRTTGIESSEFGVQYFPLSKYIVNPHYQVVFRKPIDLDDVTVSQMLLRAKIMHKEHWQYDWTGLVFWPLDMLTKATDWFPFMRKWPVMLHLPHSRFCSAFVSDCLESTVKYENWPLFDEWHVTRISPSKLWNKGPLKELKIEGQACEK